jgi:hypothetical protein
MIDRPDCVADLTLVENAKLGGAIGLTLLERILREHSDLVTARIEKNG